MARAVRDRKKIVILALAALRKKKTNGESSRERFGLLVESSRLRRGWCASTRDWPPAPYSFFMNLSRSATVTLKTLAVMGLLTALAISQAQAGFPQDAQQDAATQEDAKTVSLFNGKDLTGWHVDVPAQDDDPNIKPTFIVRDGNLVSLGSPNGHLISDEEFENYRLQVEYRFSAKPGNCGVLVHASKPRALYEMFPQSIEVQMNHEHAGDFWCIVEDISVPDMVERRGPKENWGITEGKARRILNLTDGSEKPVGEWNTMVIECVGDEVKVWVNGDLVNHGSKCTASKGHLALQAEGSEVEFRKLDMTPIEELSK